MLKKDIDEPDCSFMVLWHGRQMYGDATELFRKLYGDEKLMNVFPVNGLNVISLLKERFEFSSYNFLLSKVGTHIVMNHKL